MDEWKGPFTFPVERRDSLEKVVKAVEEATVGGLLFPGGVLFVEELIVHKAREAYAARLDALREGEVEDLFPWSMLTERQEFSKALEESLGTLRGELVYLSMVGREFTSERWREILRITATLENLFTSPEAYSSREKTLPLGNGGIVSDALITYALRAKEERERQ